MSKDPFKLGYVQTPVFSRLRVPKGADEEAECLSLMFALRAMRIVRADMMYLVHTPVPCIRVQYEDAPMPEVWWSKWLWGRITTSRNQCWLLRLAGIIPSTREMYLIPLPDKLEQRIAADAFRASNTRLSTITLGVIHAQLGTILEHALYH